MTSTPIARAAGDVGAWRAEWWHEFSLVRTAARHVVVALHEMSEHLWRFAYEPGSDVPNLFTEETFGQGIALARDLTLSHGGERTAIGLTWLAALEHKAAGRRPSSMLTKSEAARLTALVEDLPLTPSDEWPWQEVGMLLAADEGPALPLRVPAAYYWMPAVVYQGLRWLIVALALGPFSPLVFGYLAVSTVLFLASAHLRWPLAGTQADPAFKADQVDLWNGTWQPLTLLGELAVLVGFASKAGAAPLPSQVAGLAVYLALVPAWLWVDAVLSRHFLTARRGLLTSGPYRFVRHPRYLCIILEYASRAFIFASPIGWAFAALELVFLVHRIVVEEEDLRRRFGADYQRYARRTARLIPGLL